MDLDLPLRREAFVFLLDDKGGLWFQDTARVIRASGWRCDGAEQFNASVLDGLCDGKKIAAKFVEAISKRLQTDKNAHFAVVTDSEYGTDGEAGSRLLELIMNHETLRDRFKYGVVYSIRPLGIIVPGRIEHLDQKAGQIETDAKIIVEFFQTGHMGAARQLVSMIERLAFFWWLNDQAVFDKLFSKSSHLFRPVICYGQADEHAETPNYFCDPILKGLGNGATPPFSPVTLRWFEKKVFHGFEKCFDPSNQAGMAERVRKILSPMTSLCEATVNCRPSENQFGSGSLRLLWDAVMSGNNPERLHEGYYPKLQRVVSSPTGMDHTWKQYVATFRSFSEHGDSRKAFRALWIAAMSEIEEISLAAKIARERGIT